MTVPVVSLGAIESVANPGVIFDTVRAALISHAAGGTTAPPPIHMAFAEADGTETSNRRSGRAP